MENMIFCWCFILLFERWFKINGWYTIFNV